MSFRIIYVRILLEEEKNVFTRDEKEIKGGNL